DAPMPPVTNPHLPVRIIGAALFSDHHRSFICLPATVNRITYRLLQKGIEWQLLEGQGSLIGI
ncbi:hypothetical protein V3478_33645, partial [Pseudomonas aeruginosa]|uniref:hypothetical protein n=1 Tax=Pseudomonas aeruginosa TaxID=287 RepID=UPI002F926692